MGPELLAPELLAQGAQPGSATGEIVLFWVFAVVGLGAGIAMITLRNIVHAALMLVVNFVAIAALYVGLQSSFLGIIQVIVYAGAIMVLFLFVIMLLGVDRDDLLLETHRWHRVGAVALTVLVAGAAVLAFSGSLTAASSCGDLASGGTTGGDTLSCRGLDAALAEAGDSSVQVIAERMFTRYTFPLEAAALLLVVATVGAIVLGRRADPDPAADPAYAPSWAVPGSDDLQAARTDAERILDAAEDEDRAGDGAGPASGGGEGR